MCVSWSQPGYVVFDPAAFAAMVSAWKSFALFSQQHRHVSSLSSEKLSQAYYLKSYELISVLMPWGKKINLFGISMFDMPSLDYEYEFSLFI